MLATRFDRLTLTLTLNFDLISMVAGVSWLTIPVSSLVILDPPFWFYRADRQTDRQTDARDCYTHATTVNVSNKKINKGVKWIESLKSY